MIRLLFSLSLLLSVASLTAQQNPLSIFEPLVGKTWIAEGDWGDGSPFKQEIRFDYDLGKKMVRSNTNGFTNQAKTKFGKRNHGIRQWDESRGEIRFWEFDVFGGVTRGKVFSEGNTIFYQYQYGNSIVTDAWEWVNDQQYRFTVGIYADGNWEQIMLKTVFTALPEFTGPRKDLDQILVGMSAFSQAVMRGDHEEIASFYTADGKIMPSGKKIIAGRRPIAAYWKQPEGTEVMKHRIKPEAVHIEGDRAYDYGYYEGRSKNAEGKVSDWAGKYVIIWKKVDGEWLIEVDIWNRI